VPPAPPTPPDPQPPPSPPGSSQPPAAPTGGVADALVLRVSGDRYYDASPLFQVFVDGQPLGGPSTTTAVHAQGQWQDLTFSGTFDPNVDHDVTVQFINDACDGLGGIDQHDMNLFIDTLTIGQHPVQGASGTNSASLGSSIPAIRRTRRSTSTAK